MSEGRDAVAVAPAAATELPKSMHRFPVLDLLRFVAALAVVQLHCTAVVQLHCAFMLGGDLLHHGYLALDFFFMLSGFVLTLAYQRRLDTGWPTWRFMVVRLIRLYPLYALTLAVGVAYLLRVARFSLTSQTLGWSLVLSVILLPALPWTRYGPAYPYNLPTWSLVMELLANVFHGIWLRKRSQRFLVWMAAGTGVVLAAVMVRYGTIDEGASMGTLLAALPRILFSYLVGMILFRLWQRGAWKLQVPVVVIVLALLACLVGPRLQRGDVFYEVAVVLFLFPAILLAGACAVTSSRTSRVADVLGRSSYVVYVLHMPLAVWFPIVMHRVRLDGRMQHSPWYEMVYLSAVVVLSILLDRFYDAPVRAWLKRVLKA